MDIPATVAAATAANRTLVKRDNGIRIGMIYVDYTNPYSVIHTNPLTFQNVMNSERHLFAQPYRHSGIIRLNALPNYLRN